MRRAEPSRDASGLEQCAQFKHKYTASRHCALNSFRMVHTTRLAVLLMMQATASPVSLLPIAAFPRWRAIRVARASAQTFAFLCPGESATAPKLRIIPDGTGVHGLEELIVKNSSDIYSLLDRGSAKRKTAATLLNKGSSRSHSVFCVTVRGS